MRSSLIPCEAVCTAPETISVPPGGRSDAAARTVFTRSLVKRIPPVDASRSCGRSPAS